MKKQEIIEKKQNEFNDYSMEFTNKIEYDLSLGFTPDQIDKYLRKNYAPFLRDAIKFAMIFNPPSENLDALIEQLKTQKVKMSDFSKLFKAYIIDDPNALYESFMEETKKFDVEEEKKKFNPRRCKRQILKSKRVEIKMPEEFNLAVYIIDKSTRNEITGDQIEMVTKGLLYGVSEETIYEAVERNTKPRNMRRMFAIQIAMNGVDRWKI